METIESLQKKVSAQSDIIKGYEKVLKLNEKELSNADQIIKMYESIIDYSSSEMKNAQQQCKPLILFPIFQEMSL